MRFNRPRTAIIILEIKEILTILKGILILYANRPVKNMMILTQQIESELAKRDMRIGSLMVATLADYSEILLVLKQLLGEEKVVYGWKNSELFFHLKKTP